MNKKLYIALGIVGWMALAAYLLLAARLCDRRERSLTLLRTDIRVLDSASLGIVTPYMVELWLERANLDLRNRPLRQIDTRLLEHMMLEHGFVRSAKAYTEIDGSLDIELTQRHPVARFAAADGHSFYLTADGWILPLQTHHTAHVPIVTGNFHPPFGKGYIGPWRAKEPEEEKNMDENYLFFSKLIKFVEFVGHSDLWSAQVVQINVVAVPSTAAGSHHIVEFVPRAGDHIVRLGELDDVAAKMDKLMLFYRRALDYQGWDAVRYIDLSYRDQIVCRK